MNLAQVVDPETGRLPSESVPERMPTVAPWGSFLAAAAALPEPSDLPEIPVFSQRVRGPNGGKRWQKKRSNGAGRSELLRALSGLKAEAAWVDIEGLKRLLPMTDRNRLKLRLLRAVRANQVEKRNKSEGRFQYRVTAAGRSAVAVTEAAAAA